MVVKCLSEKSKIEAKAEVKAEAGDWVGFAKEKRKKPLWWNFGDTHTVVFGHFQSTPTERENEDGSKYETDDYTVEVQLDNGQQGFRKVPIYVLLEIIEQAEKQGLAKEGQLVRYTRPDNQSRRRRR